MICKYDSILLLYLLSCSNYIIGAYCDDKSDVNVCTNGKIDGSCSPPTIAIIGCGPSGIALLHAINLKRKLMEDKGDFDSISNLPIATCFERSSEPGGVWRAQTDHSNPGDENNSAHIESTNMYDALWTNGPKELFEFFDYTHEDHFNQSVPAFLPREFVLEYILARVQRNEPNFFTDARFNTQVEYVKFNKPMNKFEVTVNDLTLHQESILHFDKCIWAAGLNSLKSIPHSVEAVLQDGKFRGKMMHSSAAGDFLSKVGGKRVLMIGDAYSAEDLTLQALKLGVEKVYILSRSGFGICAETTSWPGEVEVLMDMVLTEVIDEGHGLRFSETAYNITDGTYTYPSDGISTDLEDISAVIYCTGYEMDTSMLDASLKDVFEEYDEDEFELKEYLAYSNFSTNWAMSHNSLTDLLGDVEPNDHINSQAVGVIPGIYYGMLISNPNMMYMSEGPSALPLFSLDVQAWLLLAYITGDLDTPSKDEMFLYNTQIITNLLQQPLWRFLMDPNYQTALMSNKWWDSMRSDDEKYLTLEIDAETLVMKMLAKEMQDASFPFNIGTAEELNDAGEHIVSMQLLGLHSRSHLDPNSTDSVWKTFRDHDPNGFISMHTGNTAAPFEKHWIDLDKKDQYFGL